MKKSNDIPDPATAYDEKLSRCPIAHDLFPGVSVLGHTEVVQALEDPEHFRNSVSRHLSVPNGMDPPEHTKFRRLIEPYFAPERMAAFEPVCRRIAEELCAALPREGEVEVMKDLAFPFALRIQCAFLGWPDSLREALWTWLRRNQEAVAMGHRAVLADNARIFGETVGTLLESRRRSTEPPEDVTTDLMRETVGGRPLTDAEIVSILRNWTAGEVGTLSASVGILVAYLADHPKLQAELRDHPERLEEANDEMLRLHAPLLTNRRVTACPVELGGASMEAGTPLTLVWAAANRDPAAFEDPGEFRWGREPDNNLLWGRGLHVCPGAPLAKLEMRILMEELLRRWNRWEPGNRREPAQPPAAGYVAVYARPLTG